MKITDMSKKIVSAAVLAALVVPVSAEAAIRPRRVKKLTADSLALSQDVMNRITQQLSNKDMQAMMALAFPNRGGGPAILNRSTTLDSSPLTQQTSFDLRNPITSAPAERVTFAETLSGSGTFNGSNLTFSGSGSGQRLGYRPGPITGSISGTVSSANAAAVADFQSGGNLGNHTGSFQSNVQGTGMVVGNTLVAETAQLTVSGIAKISNSGNPTVQVPVSIGSSGSNLTIPGVGALPLAFPLTASNFKINELNTGTGTFSGSTTVPLAGSQPATVNFNVNYTSQGSVSQ